MKKLLITTFVSLALASCTDSKKQEKELLDKILKIHDKVMGNDEVLMKNKLKIDSLLKLPATDTAEKVNMKAISTKLTAADEVMEKWMHNFDPDITNRSHEETMKYYTDQKKGITVVDSQINVAISESNKYLSNRSK